MGGWVDPMQIWTLWRRGILLLLPGIEHLLSSPYPFATPTELSRILGGIIII
jgi:hypothetical protein